MLASPQFIHRLLSVLAVMENRLQDLDPLEAVSLVVLLGYRGPATFLLNAVVFIRSVHIHKVNPQAVGESVARHHLLHTSEFEKGCNALACNCCLAWSSLVNIGQTLDI